MSIWRISGSLMLSQNFVKNWKFSWPRSLAKFWDFDQLFKTFISDLWMNCKSQNGNLEWSLVHLNDFWKFEVESKFCEKLKIFMTAVLSEILRFWPSFQDFHFSLVSGLQLSQWHFGVFLLFIWRISGSLRLSQNFVKNWKFWWSLSLAKFPDFDQVFKTFISDLWMNCKSQNGNLECSLVHLKDFWKFEVESKFCEKLKIFMTAVVSEISDFDQVFKTFISDL